MLKHRWIFLIFIASVISVASVHAQKKNKNRTEPSTIKYDTALFNSLKWRNVGPFRGGRSAAVTGVPGKTNLFYFGSTGGGVWKTEDGGSTWTNISDGYFGGSVGSVAVSESDNNVIYVGGGEKTVRGNVSYGYGIWKSIDAGKSWEYKGLPDSRHIPRIRIHPKNPDIVFAAVLGDLYKSSDERGIYKSIDGGNTWKKVLFANADAGAVDLVIDPNNYRVLYASTWRVRRTPYSLSSGGEGSGLWKSTDEGSTWKEITANKGLPAGTLGIIGIAVSPVKNDRVFALIESENGGVFRSEDGGKTWEKINDSRSLRQRAWYYTRIYADTKDEDVVYVMNVRYHKSKDGGRTFSAHSAPHGDHHDLWISPEDPKRMIIGDDGGAQISFDGGENWSTYHNQPTAQFYRVTTDNHFPYRIYGAQQDNSTVRIAHRTDGYSIGESDWEATAGGESAHIAVDPLDNNIVYGGSYGGFLTKVNHRTNEQRAINVWPDNPMGYGAEGMKYRFQWNFPIFFSPHNPKRLYTASNHLHVTENGGQSWETISPDLTLNDSTKLGPSGGPITKDNTGVEYYCTIFAAIESPYEKDLLWTGSDDGLIHVSKDGGKSWKNVTPAGMPKWMMINSIDADPFVKGGAYVAGTRYKSGDYTPYLYKTKDYGANWELITSGIDPAHFTRVVRADPGRKGLLYCGTETGMYISFDDGTSWQPFQRNLPIVPITDLTIKNKNLIAATQGRSFWMIDDISPLHQLSDEIANSNFHLYKPLDSYRMDGSSGRSRTAGQNHPGGVLVNFYVKTLSDSADIILEFSDETGKVIKALSNHAEDKKDSLAVESGTNLFVWNMQYEDAKKFDGMILWWASTSGPKAIPGTYQVKLKVDGDSIVQSFDILKDPRIKSTDEELERQFQFLMEIRDKLSEAHQAIIDIRKVNSQMNVLKSRLNKDEHTALIMEIDTLEKALKSIEENLYQTKNKSNQDPLNYPIKLTNKLGHLAALNGSGTFAPTQQELELKQELFSMIDAQLMSFYQIQGDEIPKLNEQILALKIPFVEVKEEK
jgi:photosystem II stability/assembly factor-like uncharacterized protein